MAADPGVIIGALGAFMSGTAALVTAIVSVRVTRRRASQECDQRIRELKVMFTAGMDMADARPLHHQREKGES